MNDIEREKMPEREDVLKTKRTKDVAIVREREQIQEN